MMGLGQGYLDDYSKSVNAAEAEANGEFPASICAKKLGIPIEAVRQSGCETVGHHTSSYYNETIYYDLRRLRGWLLMGGGRAVVADVRAEIATTRAEKPQVHENCHIEWLEWSGTRKHPKATECSADGCRVEVKGQTAMITLSAGKTFRKGLGTRGFRYEAR